MREIILIQPKAGAWEKMGARLPIGLLSIAAIPHNQGYKIKIIDQRIDANWKQTLINSLKNNPLCVGLTCMTGKQIFYALEASKIVKKYSKVPVIFGGVHATLLPEQTLENEYVDLIVLREGDITFAELVNALEKNESLKKIKGIYYKQNGKIIKNVERDFIKNLDDLPELPYELVKISDYSSLNIEGTSLDFVSSRGCPFACSFCYNYHFNKCTWRAFSAKEVVKRLKRLVEKYKIKTIYFQDDNFCADLNRLKEILQGIIRENLNIKWGTLGLRVDTAKRMGDEILHLMEKSGCVNVDIGAESGSKRILELIDKKITVEELLEVNKKLSKFPFIVKYTFMIGFPTETEKERFSTVEIALKLIKENKNAYSPFFVYTPYPGTSMYCFAINHGFVPPKNLEEWNKFSYDDWYFHFKSWFSPKQIRELKSISFTSLFSNKNIKYKINKFFIRILFDLYHPLAKLRFNNHLHFFPIDSLMSKKILGDKF